MTQKWMVVGGYSRRDVIRMATGAGLIMAAGVTMGRSPALAAELATDGSEAAWTLFNLNTASDEQLLSVPGTGDRMLDEFLEYRPYASVKQFTEEIGKYVDEDVVAGYADYLFVPIDPNTSDLETLQQLPGLNEETAQALIDARPYADDAAFITALGTHVSAELAALAPEYLASTAKETVTWLMFDLNAASDEQLLSVPGTGDRMLDEFLEYRPYASVTQFKEEIGKYVDKEIVDGYLQYLFVPVDPNAADLETLQQLPGVTAEIAQTLTDARPYADNAAFATKLGELVSADQATLAAAFLVG